MDHLKFMIESSEAETMAKKLGLKSVTQLLPLIVKSCQKLARTPISRFDVAAVGLSSDGRIFIGVNVEFPGLPLHHSIHAEQFLTTNVSNHPQARLTNIVVSAYPCGHCRQFLQEIRGAPDIQILVLDNDDDEKEEGNSSLKKINGYPIDETKDEFKPLSYFLPHRFGPDDLLHKDVPLILENRNNNLVLKDEIAAENCNGVTVFDKRALILAAVDAANMSHAPYSKSPSGVALVDDCGSVFKGSYMESAAYNPSIGPVQAAMIAYMAAKGGDGEGEGDSGAGFDRIVGAVLVEVEGAVVIQEETVRLFLSKVSPKCEFHVVYCQQSGGSTNLG